MMKAKQAKEVVVRVRNDINVLFQLSKIVSERG